LGAATGWKFGFEIQRFRGRNYYFHYNVFVSKITIIEWELCFKYYLLKAFFTSH